MNQWYGSSKQVWRLVYRASSHGYSAEAFHRQCDGIAPTYVIVTVRKVIYNFPKNPGVPVYFLNKKNQVNFFGLWWKFNALLYEYTILPFLTKQTH